MTGPPPASDGDGPGPRRDRAGADGDAGGDGDGDREAEADAATEMEVEARVALQRADLVTEDELAEHRVGLEAAMEAVIETALPLIVEDVAERLTADSWTPAMARAPEVVHTDYGPLVEAAFTAVEEHENERE